MTNAVTMERDTILEHGRHIAWLTLTAEGAEKAAFLTGSKCTEWMEVYGLSGHGVRSIFERGYREQLKELV